MAAKVGTVTQGVAAPSSSTTSSGIRTRSQDGQDTQQASPRSTERLCQRLPQKKGSTSLQNGCAVPSPSFGQACSPTPPPPPRCNMSALLCTEGQEQDPFFHTWKRSSVPSSQPGSDCSSGSRSQKSLREAARTRKSATFKGPRKQLLPMQSL